MTSFSSPSYTHLFPGRPLAYTVAVAVLDWMWIYCGLDPVLRHCGGHQLPRIDVDYAYVLVTGTAMRAWILPWSYVQEVHQSGDANNLFCTMPLTSPCAIPPLEWLVVDSWLSRACCFHACQPSSRTSHLMCTSLTMCGLPSCSSRSILPAVTPGDESDVMMDAHTEAGFIVGLPFASPGLYDFGAHGGMTAKVGVGKSTLRPLTGLANDNSLLTVLCIGSFSTHDSTMSAMTLHSACRDISSVCPAYFAA